MWPKYKIFYKICYQKKKKNSELQNKYILWHLGIKSQAVFNGKTLTRRHCAEDAYKIKTGLMCPYTQEKEEAKETRKMSASNKIK